MAYAALTSAVCSLELLMQCNHPLLNNLQRKEQISSLSKRIIAFQEFLTDYETIKHRHERLKILEGKIKEKTYQVEDIVDSKLRKYFLAKNANYRRKAFEVLCKRLQVAIEEMEFIKKEVMKIKGEKISTLKFRSKVSPARHASTSSPNVQQKPVGFQEDLEKIVDRLRGGPSELDIITIVGMAGIGKTTLAKRAYNDPSVVNRFDVHAWITVSQEYRERDILFDLFYSVVPPTNEINQESDKQAADQLYGGLTTHSSKEIYERRNQETADRVYKSLKWKRFLIVVDDMWSTDAWDNVSRLFPDDNKGSRIILTSRLTDLATYANPDGQPHRLDFLNNDEGWELLHQKLFGKRGCPFELEKIGRSIAEKCQGLPLAIVVVAGHLSKMSKTTDCWNTVAESVGSVVNREPGQCLDILALSYNYLPQHLKACFLYMGAFPEDFEIPVWKLIRLWVAEGFLNATGLTTVEEIAEECLEDLIDRSLVLAVKRSNGKLKTCKLHDIMRDFCLEEAKRQNFLHFLKKQSLDVLSEGITALRRVSFNCSTIFSSYSFHPTDPTVSFSRSILGFNISESPIFSYIDFKLLRVLDILDITSPYFPQFPSEIMQLVNLRYLALATSSEFPPAISQFWSLQTLILHVYSRDSTLPREIWKMPNLRHLHIKPSICLPSQTNEERSGHNSLVLNNLQTLTNITLADCTTDVFSSTPKLKKLGICETVEYTYPVQIPWSDFLYTSENLWPYCSDTISDLWSDCLRNLALLPQLEALKIVGLRPPVQVPKLALHLDALPENLKKLTLRFTYLPWESMTSLCRLPNLEVLKLKPYAFTGPKWEQVEEGFCSLKLLQIEMFDLEHWSASNDHFPVLEHLVLKNCLLLDSIPHDLGDIPTLQIIELENSSQSAVLSAKEIQEEQQSMGNETLEVRMERNFGRINAVATS
ncbi:putative late blight resistance protein homolog R1B-16 [Solanum verrucosum]|uniref:putative late blight resistance protein homolog R1B-16 n=1 Tax=Solanum verrucosum TaxID=315347 RepID=UPI0020D0CC2B|nr:putative late blight resistance protein homolog R1B-16 [Solanum verrucosum]